MEIVLFLFTFGYIFQHVASIILIKRIHEKKSVAGLS
jgi:hypothetical protein